MPDGTSDGPSYVEMQHQVGHTLLDLMSAQQIEDRPAAAAAMSLALDRLFDIEAVTVKNEDGEDVDIDISHLINGTLDLLGMVLAAREGGIEQGIQTMRQAVDELREGRLD